MTISSECEKVTLGIVPALGAGLDVMDLQMPVAAAQLAGELVPPENLEHDLFLTPGPAHLFSILEIPLA